MREKEILKRYYQKKVSDVVKVAFPYKKENRLVSKEFAVNFAGYLLLFGFFIFLINSNMRSNPLPKKIKFMAVNCDFKSSFSHGVDLIKNDLLNGGCVK